MAGGRNLPNEGFEVVEGRKAVRALACGGRTADDDEHHWILKYCRKGWDETVGVRDGWRMNK